MNTKITRYVVSLQIVDNNLCFERRMPIFLMIFLENRCKMCVMLDFTQCCYINMLCVFVDLEFFKTVHVRSSEKKSCLAEYACAFCSKQRIYVYYVYYCRRFGF